MIDLEEATTFEALEALRPEWSALFDRCPGATPFQSPEWLLPWWKYFGAGRLWVFALRREGRLAGLAPFFIGAAEESPRPVRLIGTGLSDTLGLLLEPGVESAGTARVIDHLARRRDRWDLCDFQELPAGDPLLAAPVPLRDRVVPQSVLPRLLLPETTSQEKRPPLQPKNLRRARRRLEKAGRFCFERADEGRLSALLDAFFRLHEARWEKREGSGVLADRAVQAFHGEAAAGFLRRGMLRLYGLRLEERVIASLYAFARGGVLYCYLSGFDPGRARVSPGALLIEHAIEEAIRNGFHEIDFLRGREGYKYLWGASDRVQYRRWILQTPLILPQAA